MKNKTIVFIFVITFILAGSCKTPPKPTDPVIQVQDIYAGNSNVFVLLSDGRLFSSGYNFYGQLGFENDGTGSAASPLTEVKSDGVDFSEVQFIAGGESCTVILKNDGTLWGVGASPFGELGLGTGNRRLQEFTQLKDGTGSNISGVRELTAGNNSVLFVKNDGTLWAAGYNYYGELGFGDNNNRSSFNQVTSAGQNVKAVAAGVRHTVILKNDNTVWASGYNFAGQLGLGNQVDTNAFTQVSGIRDVTQIAAGNYHTVILRSDGTVWTAGENFYGQLGRSSDGQFQFAQAVDSQGRAINDATEIVANGELTLIRRKDGSLYIAGNLAEPVYDSDSSVPEDENKTGSGFTALTVSGDSFKDDTKIGVGLRNIYVISADGRLWVAGSNEYGQMSLGHGIYDIEDSLALKLVVPVFQQ
jgi:alpha-tubulin suppressor-like RCC1 family protein